MPFDPTTLLGSLNFSTLPEQLVNGLLLGAIYALIALGYTMVYGVLRLITSHTVKFICSELTSPSSPRNS